MTTNPTSHVYLAIGGVLHQQKVYQQFPVTRVEVDVQGQSHPYRRIPVTMFERTFEVLVYEPMTNQTEVASALANSLLSPSALELWDAGLSTAPKVGQSPPLASARPDSEAEDYGRGDGH